MGKKKASRQAKTFGGNAAAKADRGLKDFCRSLPGTTEDIKWGDDHVFSVGKKMYAGFDVEGEASFGFKCTPEEQLRLVQREGIIPAPYAAKYGWVLVEKRGALSAADAKKYLRKSYDLVLAGLTKKVRAEILAIASKPH